MELTVLDYIVFFVFVGGGISIRLFLLFAEQM